MSEAAGWERTVLSVLGQRGPHPRGEGEHDGEWHWVKSYMNVRFFVGLIGLLLPLSLSFFITWTTGRWWHIEDSFSAFYYTGSRDIFVGSLCAVGVFLFSYKLSDRNADGVPTRESRVSTLGGLGALVLAIFPTSRPPSVDAALTPLQARFGEGTVSNIHFIGAAVFIVSLMLVAIEFARAEGPDSPRPLDQNVDHEAQMARRRLMWWVHIGAATAIFCAGAFYIIYSRTNPDFRYTLYITEFVTSVAFGVSWLVKGAETFRLRGPT